MTLNGIRCFIFCVHDFVLVTVVGALGVINETLLRSCVYEGLTTYREPTVHLKPVGDLVSGFARQSCRFLSFVFNCL